MPNRFVFVVLAFVHLTECHIISSDKTKDNRRVKITLPTIKHSDEIGKFTQFTDALDFVHQQSHKFDNLNENIAKNLILFMGDGMGIPISTASRIHSNGEKGALSFEQFPFVGMSKTYCVNQMVADSACSATAYLCGVKGNLGTVGVSAKVPRCHCTAGLDPSTHAPSIAQWAVESGKSIGLVTNTRVTHASPSGVYAHTANRLWETNADVLRSNCDDKEVDDIAEQLVYGLTGSQMKVIFGGGRGNFLNETVVDEEGHRGQRTDGKNLIHEWLERGRDGEQRHYIRNKEELLSIVPDENGRYLGLFATSHMEFNYKIAGFSDEIPTLSEMTMKAIEILSQNPKGFFLFVEGGHIDFALHDNRARIAIDETTAFASAVEVATKMVDFEETLIVSTADHAHTMSISGSPERGSNMLGTGDRSDIDKLPYLKLNFANGASYYQHFSNSTSQRMNPLEMSDLTNFEFQSPAAVPSKLETHGGSDVAVYAIGPYAHLFTGSIEQNAIPHFMAYAACIGSGLVACDSNSDEQ